MLIDAAISDIFAPPRFDRCTLFLGLGEMYSAIYSYTEYWWPERCEVSPSITTLISHNTEKIV